MRRFSYVLGSCGLVVLLLSMGSVAKADAVDPAIGVRGCTTGCSILVGPESSSFDTTIFGGVAERTFGFINHTGQTAVELDLLLTSLSNTPALTYACLLSGQYYDQCTTQDAGGGQVLVKYTNSIEGFGGIPNDPDASCGDGGCHATVPAADAELFVRDRTGFTDFSSLRTDQGFTVHATLIAAPVPEPATIALLSTGLGLLGISRRRKKKAA